MPKIKTLKKNKHFRTVFFYKKKNPFAFEKNGPSEFLYGLNYLQKKIPVLSLFSNEYQLKYLPLKLIEKFLAKKALTGIHFQAFLNNKNKISENDLIFAVNDGLSFGLLFYKLINKLDNRIIVLIQGIHDRYKYFKNSKILINFYQKLLEKADLILTLSEYEKKILTRFLKINPQKIKVFYFGVDLKYWDKNKVREKKLKKEFVLTLGNDMHRDYSLLINHYHLNIPLKFITKTLTPDQLKNLKGKNFQYHLSVSNQELRQLYYRAKFIIVPLKNTLATSGLSVTLQAMAMEKPVLLAEAPALKELFKNYHHVLYYKMNDSKSFKQKLKELNQNKHLRNKLSKNGRELIEKQFNTNYMGKNLRQIIKSFY
ncbi:hypothetical protein COT75_02930 [Candidatus Beckwithbacteria bacterium CG10_big_fil_rev_8_21_14_0_10_34_10]|uniref:Glycosyl transferase family 1 domain-containing protein n=1 Tax=Candidatus Beckwithbacteria bacterium CG10_big_fil_rev_8_21_14_0_10_34_10 TaxID=1974495 RepID=A0A2H0WBB8_9BACT|nr:MAG: hypothetical protein COT75_02930 [Candidatus Beckwithbacteria bacterium CG10_big_fil_rev_8_21_14_0_10_34_10]